MASEDTYRLVTGTLAVGMGTSWGSYWDQFGVVGCSGGQGKEMRVAGGLLCWLVEGYTSWRQGRFVG